MYSNAANFVKGVDDAFVIIIGICLFFFIGVTFFLIYFVIKYNRKKHPKPVQVKESMKLELAWTIIPTIIVLVMFVFGWIGYTPTRKVPAGAIKVEVTGRMWNWSFEYENGKLSNDVLVVPINKAVKLNLFSPDVVHSFYIPAFRIKEDVVPGKKNYMWFKAEKLGEYDILCAEYCGLRHSYMLGKVKVVSLEDFEKWYNTNETASTSAEPVGLQIIKKNACTGCHSLDGSKLVGPSFKNLFGTNRVVITDGNKRTLQGDEEYITRSVYNPNADVVEGFNKGLMQSYKDMISPDEMKEIISYLKQLKEK
jgi:cytochrome c oxidase subunit 2